MTSDSTWIPAFAGTTARYIVAPAKAGAQFSMTQKRIPAKAGIRFDFDYNYSPIAFPISSTTFFASPNTIIVFGM